eukprot:TRINITY_DN3817_c0_g1_i1.p1 TRINITY_DN3817_c0_g1~~TRINITY_DN3817_c0_g1_i1.p1  ORF type:complete len:147 (-),score=12.71 TRINITY_DN3817_c0_g1_i1:178-618(-)
MAVSSPSVFSAALPSTTATTSAALFPPSSSSLNFSPFSLNDVRGRRRFQGRCRATGNGNGKSVAVGGMASGLVATAAAIHASSLDNVNAAIALVDERMSTEGTGLSLGLSNPLLGWILLGVFGLIWALYLSTYTKAAEDEDSGLSL